MTSKNLWGIEFLKNEAFKKQLIKEYKDNKNVLYQHVSSRGKNLDLENISELYSDNGIKHYLISANVINTCQKIKIQDPCDYTFYGSVKNGKKQFNFGNTFFRYLKTDNDIFLFTSTSTNEVNNQGQRVIYAFGHIDTNQKEIAAPPDEYSKKALTFFLQMLTFIELAEIEEIVIEPNEKIGKKRDLDNFRNDETFPITMVKTNWNFTINTSGFPVGSHLRNQPYGPGRSLRKLILINAFTKKGYTLKAGKLTEEKDNYELSK